MITTIYKVLEKVRKKNEKNLTSPKQTKKDTLTSSSTPPAPMFSNLATNVSNMEMHLTMRFKKYHIVRNKEWQL